MWTADAHMHELEDFQPGDVVLTPSGRRAVIQKLLSGASKHDPFARVKCRYEDGDDRDLVTLQPHQLRRCQMFQKNTALRDTFPYERSE